MSRVRLSFLLLGLCDGGSWRPKQLRKHRAAPVDAPVSPTDPETPASVFAAASSSAFCVCVPLIIFQSLEAVSNLFPSACKVLAGHESSSTVEALRNYLSYLESEQIHMFIRNMINRSSYLFHPFQLALPI